MFLSQATAKEAAPTTPATLWENYSAHPHCSLAGNCDLNTKLSKTNQEQSQCIRDTTSDFKSPGATRNFVFAGSDLCLCILQPLPPSSLIFPEDQNTVLVKKSRFALESGLPSRSANHPSTSREAAPGPWCAGETAFGESTRALFC